MLFVDNAKPGAFTLQLYEMLLREAPVDYLEATEVCWRAVLYFIAYADLPDELFNDRCHLKFHYTTQ
jgi:hypothetical protein